MVISKRQSAILRSLQQYNSMRVTDLADHFMVTPTSIRRDLTYLQEVGHLTRSHGYATLIVNNDIGEIDERSTRNPDEKKRIAEVAIKFLSESESIVFDSGTTIYALAEQIAQDMDKHITAVTNSIDTARCLALNTNCQVTLTGGLLQPRHMSLIGPDADAFFDNTVADTAFIGTTGIVSSLGLTASSPFQVSIKRKMIASSKRIIVLCDSSKLTATGAGVFAPFSQITALVTIRTPENSELIDSLIKQGVNIVLA